MPVGASSLEPHPLIEELRLHLVLGQDPPPSPPHLTLPFFPPYQAGVPADVRHTHHPAAAAEAAHAGASGLQHGDLQPRLPQAGRKGAAGLSHRESSLQPSGDSGKFTRRLIVAVKLIELVALLKGLVEATRLSLCYLEDRETYSQ